jgi:tRNA-dihydrouridine synthase 1
MHTWSQALSIPVLANGNIRNLADALACLEHTGCDGVLSAESLLEDPGLFSPTRLTVRVVIWQKEVEERTGEEERKGVEREEEMKTGL